jgi:sugar transferase (PEP-CTERM/EpsH1 system associated)
MRACAKEGGLVRVRILHVMDTLEVGGLENGVANLIQRMDSERFEHAVCTVRRGGSMTNRLPLDRVRIVNLDSAGSRFSSQVGSLARTIRAIKPHIVHSRNWGAIEAVLAGWWTGSCAVVHSEHGIESVGDNQDPLRRRWFRRLSYSLAEQVFCVSHQLCNHYEKTTGFPARRMTVIHNGVDVARFYPQPAGRSRMREQLGIPSEDFCIGALGRLEPIKNLMTLLDAAAVIPVSRKHWRILIAGAGSDLPMLRQAAESRTELRGHVQFVGEIEDAPRFLNALDAYVLPSMSEGISNSLLEAMATGLPVIVSAIGGNPEVVVDNESGLLFPAGDPGALADRLLLVWEHGETRTRLGQEAVQRVEEHFSVESMVREYESLYSRLAAGRIAVGPVVEERLIGGGTRS